MSYIESCIGNTIANRHFKSECFINIENLPLQQPVMGCIVKLRVIQRFVGRQSSIGVCKQFLVIMFFNVLSHWVALDRLTIFLFNDDSRVAVMFKLAFYFFFHKPVIWKRFETN